MANSQQDYEDSDSEAEEWDDDDDNGMNNPSERTGRSFRQTEISRLLSTNGLYGDDEDDEDEDEDPDALADPIYKLNLRQYLNEIVGEFVKQPFFQEHFCVHLNEMEKKALSSIGISL